MLFLNYVMLAGYALPRASRVTMVSLSIFPFVYWMGSYHICFCKVLRALKLSWCQTNFSDRVIELKKQKQQEIK